MFSSTTAFVVLGSRCGLQQPSDVVLDRHRWVMGADRDVMAYACPELQRKPLEAEDPLLAAIIFVQQGKELSGWATDQIDEAEPTPRSLATSLDSLQASIGRISSSFSPAVATGEIHYGKCYGNFALNCVKLPLARSVIWHIDGFKMGPALEDYLRHRAALAEAFAKEGAPLGALATCREGPPPVR